MSEVIATHFCAAVAQAREEAMPYTNWRLRDALPEDVLRAIISLPVPAPEISDTQGRRETHNATRSFLTGAPDQAPLCRALAEALQSRAVVAALQARCGVSLQGSFLRLEYCQDRDGFWLEPHTDIGAKFFTALIYLADPAPGEEWGTDIFAAPGEHAGTVPYRFNQGLVFIPSATSWHGFIRRKITGIRRTLIINYVTQDWRARHELAFPAQAVA
jgi:hypothetical protein